LFIFEFHLIKITLKKHVDDIFEEKY